MRTLAIILAGAVVLLPVYFGIASLIGRKLHDVSEQYKER